MERGVEAVKWVVGKRGVEFGTKRAWEGLGKAGRWAVGGGTTIDAARWVVELTPPILGRKTGRERGGSGMGSGISIAISGVNGGCGGS